MKTHTILALALVMLGATVFGAAYATGAPDAGYKKLFDQIDSGYVDEGAIKSLRAAAEGGSGPAALRLAHLYMTGVGMEISFPLAYRWYYAAALHHVPTAIDHASKIYNCMGPSARLQAEDLVAANFTNSELGQLQAMTPNVPMEGEDPCNRGMVVKSK